MRRTILHPANALSGILLLLTSLIQAQESREKQIQALCSQSELYADSIGNKAEKFADEAIHLAGQSGDSCMLTHPWYCKGVALHAKSRYSKAADYYIRAFEQSEQCGDLHTAIKTSNNLGVLYRITGQYNACREWFTKAGDLAAINNDVQGEIQAINNLGNLAASQSQNDSAKMYYQTSLKLMELHPEEATEEASVRINYAWVLYASGEKDASLEQYNKALSVLQNAPDPYAEAVCLKNMAELLMEEEQYKEAKLKLLQAENLYREFENKSSLADLYHLLYQTELSLQNHRNSLAYLEKYQALQDSIDTRDMHALLADIQEKYDNERLKKEKLMQEKQLARRQHVIVMASLLLVFLLVTLVFIIRNSRIRKRNLQILTGKNRTIQEGLDYGRFVKEKQMRFSPETMHEFMRDYFILDMPRDTVGGDFYLVREKSDCLFVLVGDATGHGVPGGFISQRILHLMDEAILQNDSPADILKQALHNWKQKSAQNNSFDDGFTASLAKVSRTGKACLALWKQKAVLIEGAEAKTIKNPSGNRPADISEVQLEINKGNKLIMSSDGYYDQLSEKDKRPMKFSRFKNLETWQLSTTRDAKESLSAYFSEWKGKTAQTDDVLVLGLYW